MNVSHKPWLSVVALAIGAFIFNTTEYIPIALLSDIGQSFGMAATETGIMITVYAWIVALTSLPLMLLTRHMERRGLLLVLFALFTVSHILSSASWRFEILLASRVGIALTHAVFWSITASLAVRIAPAGKGNQALGLLSTGTVMAMVAGIPLGRMVGQYLGWQASFLLIGLCAAAVMAVLAKSLPPLPSVNTGSLSSLPLLLKRKKLMLLYAMTVLVITAHFTAYSYIEPFMLNISQMSAQTATFILLVFGLSGIVASLLFNRLHRFGPAKFLVATMGILVGALCLLQPLSDNTYFMFLLVFVWGIGISAVSLSLQIRVLQLAPDATDVAMAMFSGIYNIGIGGGALIGGQVMQYLGLPNIGFIGSTLAAIGLILFVKVHLKYRHLPIKALK